MVRRVGFGESSTDGAVGRRQSVLGRYRSRPEVDHAPDDTNRDSSKSKGRTNRFALLLLLFPLIFAGFGGYMMWDAIRFSGVAVKAVGTVVDVHVNSDSDGTTYTPVFQYRDASGRSHISPTHISSSGYDYRVGEREEIFYNSDDPSDDVRINGLFSLWGMPVIFTGVGLLFLLGISYGFAKRRRSRARA